MIGDMLFERLLGTTGLLFLKLLTTVTHWDKDGFLELKLEWKLEDVELMGLN